MALNEIANEIGYDYDDNGAIARLASINEELLTELNSIKFYQEKGPKSLGIEWYKGEFQTLLMRYNCSKEDKLRTLVEHMAIQISNSMIKGDALVCGGGVHNLFLIERLKENTTNKIVIPDDILINFKEALIFAYLGYLRLLEKPNVLSSVTGSSRDHIAGQIDLP